MCHKVVNSTEKKFVHQHVKAKSHVKAKADHAAQLQRGAMMMEFVGEGARLRAQQEEEKLRFRMLVGEVLSSRSSL